MKNEKLLRLAMSFLPAVTWAQELIREKLRCYELKRVHTGKATVNTAVKTCNLRDYWTFCCA